VRFIEVDAQLAANGVPVAVRDPMVMGVDGVRMVSDLTAAEITQVEVSEPERFGARFKGTCIPRLVDVLSLLTKRPETTVFVTIGNASVQRFGHDQVAAQLLEALKPFRGRCIVVSSDLPAVHRVRQAAGFPIGWAISSFDNHTRIKYEALQPEYLFCERQLLPESYQLWRGPWRWVIRDVPTLAIALDLAAHGADFVATPDARSLGEAMRALAATLSTPRPSEPAFIDEGTTIARTTLVPRAQKI
jgi:glycerophosphoryl diester phosphodiesterase